MPQFGFYRLGDAVEFPLTVIAAPDLADAKRQARVAIDAEGLAAVRLWADGQTTIEVRPPAPPFRTVVPPVQDDRGKRMAERKAKGATYRAIGAEFGVSKDRVADIIAASQSRARFAGEQPNRAALSVRARNALPHLIEESEDDLTERDRLLPGRVAMLTARQIERLPNLGKHTVNEIELWLWERGLTLGN